MLPPEVSHLVPGTPPPFRPSRVLHVVRDMVAPRGGGPRLGAAKGYAEHALRKAALWQEHALGSASRAGSLFVERMLTVRESLRAQGRSTLDFIVETLHAQAHERVGPTLLPRLAV